MFAMEFPPQKPPCFESLTPETIIAETEEIISATSALHDQLATTFTPTIATFENVVRPIVDDGNRTACRLVILSELLAQLSPSVKVRQAARQAELKIASAKAQNLMRQDVAALVFAVYDRETSMPSGDLDVQDRHLLSSMRGKYVRSGAGLRTNEERERFRIASDELSQVCAAAQDTFVEPEDGIWFERAELTGVPDAFLATMLQDDTRVQVTFRRNHIGAVLAYATSSDTRRRLTIADWHRLPDNVTRLEKAVALRDEIARLLGYQHHAALKMESRMATSVINVKDQLEDLLYRLKPVAQLQTDHLLKLKKKDLANEKEPVSELYSWDISYYSRQQKEDNHLVIHPPIAEYFEARHTLQAMLTLFHDLFGMEFRPTTASVWHDSVTPYQVWDTPSEGGAFLGYLYTDLFEREGKYRGAHCIMIKPGFTEHNGMKHYPVVALVCCYANPNQSRPTLLQHNEVTTMFHELGHAIHDLVSRTKYCLGRSRDYSEIPSNLLENWTWIPDVLVRIGRHYTAPTDEGCTTGTIPHDLAEAVCASRNLSRAAAVLGHVWPAQFDLAIHTPSTHVACLEMDTTDIWNTTKQRASTASCGKDPSDWGAGQARFIHMFRHNDAGYFSYPMSIAYSADLFASAFAKDPMNTTAGRRWRYQVLEQGASRSEMKILEEFLGRKPSTKAILDELTGECHVSDSV